MHSMCQSRKKRFLEACERDGAVQAGGKPMNHADLTGRSAIASGAARGIGYACAGRLLVSGTSVAMWDQVMRDG